uniref:Mesoderm induction early response 1, family member 3 a n=1 Tax=Petromyzon marinus TaxID=7757 RepID=S4R6N8_PETMA
MLVHEFDDERTLEEEEEARESEHNFSSEVEDLEKEGEMPLEELLALYGYGAPLTAAALPGGASPESDLPDNLPEMTLDKEEIAKDLLSGEDDESQSSADDLMPSVISNGTQDIFGCSFQLDTEMDGNEGTDFSDEDECVAAEERKTVMVGSQYQAIIPAGLFRYQADSGPADEAQWDPCVLPESQVLLYLREAAEGGVAPAPSSRCRLCQWVSQALRELMACNYDTREALARLRLAPAPPRDEMHKWTDEERLKFEEGFRLHYKDFHV